MNLKKFYVPACFIVGLAIGAYAANQFPYYAQKWEGTGSRYKTTEFYIGTPSSGAAAIFAPGTTNVNALGSTSLRFSNVYTTLLNTSGAATLSGAVTATSATNVLGVYISTAPRSSVTVAALTFSTGTFFYNSTTNSLCYSTATTQTSVVAASAPTTACGI